jgi:uncharacterized lipoprotein YmbA
MKAIYLDQLPRFTLILLVVILVECASSPSSKYYQLDPLQDSASITRAASPERNLIIAIGPVHMPDYLDRGRNKREDKVQAILW